MAQGKQGNTSVLCGDSEWHACCSSAPFNSCLLFAQVKQHKASKQDNLAGAAVCTGDLK
jgi:hypothetical protein